MSFENLLSMILCRGTSFKTHEDGPRGPRMYERIDNKGQGLRDTHLKDRGISYTYLKINITSLAHYYFSLQVFFRVSYLLRKKETLIRSLCCPPACLSRDFMSEMLGDVESKLKTWFLEKIVFLQLLQKMIWQDHNYDKLSFRYYMYVMFR